MVTTQIVLTITIIITIILLMDKILHYFKYPLNYGNYGIFLIMGHAGFCPSAVVIMVMRSQPTGLEIIRL